MDLVAQYIEKVRQSLHSLGDLELEYKNKTKSRIYIEKKAYYKRTAQHWKDKLTNLGRESIILEVEFDWEKPTKDPKVFYCVRYRTYYIGINQDIAQQLILINHPGATSFTYNIIEAGILKEI
jgi:hypothetical protein